MALYIIDSLLCIAFVNHAQVKAITTASHDCLFSQLTCHITQEGVSHQGLLYLHPLDCLYIAMDTIVYCIIVVATLSIL